MQITPESVCLFIPPELRRFKFELFERIGSKFGRVCRGDLRELENLPPEITPVVGCTPALRSIIDEWNRRGRRYVYWDRGYARRVFATWLPRGVGGGYYRWHVGATQLREIRRDLPADRWESLGIAALPWRSRGRHVVIAAPTLTYGKFHGLRSWIEQTLDELALHTRRQIVIRCKETKRPLQEDLEGAHALVSHGSIAAVEAVILGCPVFVDGSSAAALVGLTSLARIETPVRPDRTHWLRSLAYSQFNERELTDGTLWRLLT